MKAEYIKKCRRVPQRNTSHWIPQPNGCRVFSSVAMATIAMGISTSLHRSIIKDILGSGQPPCIDCTAADRPEPAYTACL